MAENVSNRIKKADLASGRGYNAVAGFTLLETLIALAILSIASLALMQSTISTLRSSERAIEIAELSVERNIQRQSFRQLLHGMVMDWSRDDEARFQGAELGMNALSSALTEDRDDKVRPISILIRNDRGGASILVVENQSERPIARFERANARFKYLGKDRALYDMWPPENIPSSGIRSDDIASDMPEWPLAVILEMRQEDGTTDLWIESLERIETQVLIPSEL